jgi:hypothetical protein
MPEKNVEVLQVIICAFVQVEGNPSPPHNVYSEVEVMQTLWCLVFHGLGHKLSIMLMKETRGPI